MKYLLILLTALLTLAAGLVLLRALLPFLLGAGGIGSGGFGVVVGGVSEKLLVLLAALSALFVALFVIHRRRNRT